MDVYLQAASAGFALGFSLILAIGAQNAFVLRQGLRRQHVGPIVLFCAVSDLLLIAGGVAGFGALVERLPWLEPAMRIGGAGFLIWYGASNLIAAWRGGETLGAGAPAAPTLGAALLTVVGLTWLNPHVYLDTLVFVGLVASNYASPWVFGAGAAAASFVFFPVLGYGARFLTPLFEHPKAGQILDVIVGLTMWTLAIKLIFFT